MTPIQTLRLKKHWPIATGMMDLSTPDKSPFTPVSYTLIPSLAPGSINPRIASIINNTTGTGIVNYTN